MNDIERAIKLLQEIQSLYMDKQSDNLDEKFLLDMVIGILKNCLN